MARTDDILLANGRFVDPSVGTHSLGEALLARQGRIVFVGAEAETQARAAPGARRFDLGGRTAVPGFVDAHVHLRYFGASLGQCDLSGTANRAEAVNRLAAFAAAHGEAAWVRGRGYNLNAWDDPSYPTAAQLDEAVSDRPCVAVAFDGHSAWANSAALAAAGLDKAAPDPDGGVIVRDDRGRPAGSLLESATGLVYRAIPADDEDAIDAQIRAAVDELARRGHTAVHAMIAESPEAMGRRIERLYPPGRCPLRIRMFASFAHLDEMAGLARSLPRGARVQAGGVKCLIDGSLGSRTAWLFEPFTDGAGNRGVAVLAAEELRRRIERTNAAGLPLVCHAIGDRACAETLRAFCDAGDPAAGNRVEHAQILRPDDLDLFARAGVAASVQPGHIRTDWQPSEKLLGPRRARWSFPFRGLLDRGAVLAAGSDAPVVPPDLQASLHAAVTRTDADGQPAGGWHGEERITPLEWGVAATGGAWRSVGQAEGFGGLGPGMVCDLAVLSDDVFAPGRADLLGWRVEATIVAGEPTERARGR